MNDPPNQGAGSKSRRRHTRISVRWEADCLLSSGHTDARCLDLSPGGARLSMPWVPRVGSVFPLTVKPPKSPGVIATLAEIRWRNHRRSQAGVNFVAIAPESWEHFPIEEPVVGETHTSEPKRAQEWLDRLLTKLSKGPK